MSERKKTEINLEMHNKALLKVNKELDRFVYSVSHDLRNPLTSIQGLISIIEDESKEPETLEHISMIKNSINRLDEFIRKILSYSQNNRTDLQIEAIPVKKTILNIVSSLQNVVQAKGIHFEVDIEEQSPFCTDKLGFNTILENLISNAVKYHKPFQSKRFIRVTGKVGDKNIQLKISDNGIGIPLQFQEKIFDMFYRISSKSTGSGIGLYIVKDTVEKLQGTIQVYSKIDKGTTFYITLKKFKICSH
ncbi:MAG: signal transduction histidine kinase [Urechidicola sp.]|jgi:signal transduction histidine kinase